MERGWERLGEDGRGDGRGDRMEEEIGEGIGEGMGDGMGEGLGEEERVKTRGRESVLLLELDIQLFLLGFACSVATNRLSICRDS